MRNNRSKTAIILSLIAAAVVAVAVIAAETSKPASAPATGEPSKAPAVSCEEIKSGIEAKIKAKGVKAFTLEVVGKDEAKDAKVVGNCEGGSKLITYKRG